MTTINLDTSVPALLVKSGPYATHHGGLGVMRSLGRLGVSVYSVSQGRRTAAERSRYLTGLLRWPGPGADFVGALTDVVRRIGRPVVPIATDDQAAILLAEHAAALGDLVRLPAVAPGLPNLLAGKLTLAQVCQDHATPSPAVRFPKTTAQLAQMAEAIGFPLVVKPADAQAQLHPKLHTATIIADAAELARFVTPDLIGQLLLQEYVAQTTGSDWFYHAYFDSRGDCALEAAGRKIRSWPPRAGVTTFGELLANPSLAKIARQFCLSIGYRGVVATDWRYDARTGSYLLVDFNPRIGAQFRIGETQAGVDLVRALHLDMTGRSIPRARQTTGRRIVIENLDFAARRGYRRLGLPQEAALPGHSHTELGWWAGDDPIPALAVAARPALRLVERIVRSH